MSFIFTLYAISGFIESAIGNSSLMLNDPYYKSSLVYNKLEGKYFLPFRCDIRPCLLMWIPDCDNYIQLVLVNTPRHIFCSLYLSLLN